VKRKQIMKGKQTMKCRKSTFLLSSLCGVGVTAVAAAETPMNVVFILADDLGWSDTTLYGTTTLYETPNLERLAQRGMTFTRAYSASPLCSPTRASILTGRNPARLGLTNPNCHLPDVSLQARPAPDGPPGSKETNLRGVSRLDTKYPTLGKQVKAAGYATAHFGKWHLGAPPYSPLEHGFDIDIPHWPGPGPGRSYLAPWSFETFKENVPGEHIEDRMAEEAVKWMDAQVAAGQPFYMHYWQFSVHGPWQAKQELIDYYRGKIDLSTLQNSPTYAAMVHSLDQAVGTLLDEIDRLGIADRTAIVFLSDNGGNIHSLVDGTVPTCNAPLRGGKASMFEGGIRVPGVIVWPGVTRPGTRSDAMIQSTDLYPLIHNLLGIPLPPDYALDGEDFTPALRGEPWERSRPMVTYFPHTVNVHDWLPPSMSVHSGDWKLIRLFFQGEDGAHDYLLYNLAKDIGETTNLASAHPERVAAMDRIMEEYIREAGVVTPIRNPAFDPAAYRPDLIGVQRNRPPVPPVEVGGEAPSADATETLQGWRARKMVFESVSDGARLANAGSGALIMKADMNVAAPAVLEIELTCSGRGQGEVQWRTVGQKDFDRKAKAKFRVERGRSTVKVPLGAPDGEVILHLRLSLPVDTASVVLHRIRLAGERGTEDVTVFDQR